VTDPPTPDEQPLGATARAGVATPRRRRAMRLLSKLAVGASILTLLASAVGFGFYRYYAGKLSVIAIPGTRQASVPADAAQNFLLVGSDTRAFVGGQQFQARQGASDYVSGQRSDTVILVHIPRGRGKATLVSFPRDSFVQIPAYTDKTGARRQEHPGKLNEAFADGGGPLLVTMIEALTGLRIDHYVQVDFGGFEKMVDALGGVNLCVGTSRHDADSGDYLTAGYHRNVKGAQALAFVRDRKGLVNGDIDRIKDQQYFLSQMLKKTLSAGTLANPLTVNRLLTALTSNVTVDTGFGFAQIRTLASRLRHLDPGHVTLTTIPFSDDNAMRTFSGYRQSVVLLDPVADAALFARLRDPGRSASPSAAPSPGATDSAAPGPARTPAASPTATPVTAGNVGCAP
jgi:LCP family protein required for cell wall assembly